MSLELHELSRRRSLLIALNSALLPLFAPWKAFSQNSGAVPLASVSPRQGTISTVVGGGPIGDRPAADSAISAICALAVDANDNVYASDNNYHRVYKIAADTKVLTSIAGTGVPGYSGDGGPAGDAKLNYPYGIASDSAGNICIADSNNDRVRYVEKSSGLIYTIAGVGFPGFNGDSIPASNAELAGPRGVAFRRPGLIYIADSSNHRIRVVNLGSSPVTIFPQRPRP